MPRATQNVLALMLILPIVLSIGPRAHGQEESVKPGINDSFRAPDVEDFVERFEREGREIYDQRNAIVRKLGLQPGMTVADIGAGTGLFTRLFAPKVGERGKVYAVDIAKNFVDHILTGCREDGLTNVEGVVCKSDDVGLPPTSTDIAFTCDTYHHFEFPLKTVRSIHKALRPGGKLIVIDFERIEGKSSDWILGHVRAGKEVFTKEITSCGFRYEGEEKLLSQNYFLRFVKTAEVAGGERKRILAESARDRWQKPNDVIRLLGDLKAKKVLDLGCGRGYFTKRLAQAGARVIAADVRKDLLDDVAARARAEGVAGSIETRLVPPSSPSLEPGEVDIVLVVNAYHHIKERPTYFAAVRGGLRDAGWLVVVDFKKEKTPEGPSLGHRIAAKQVLGELLEGGYREFRVDTKLLPNQYIIHAR